MTVSNDTIFSALDATWPPAQSFEVGPWVIREGAGGGQRVSAATLIGDAGAEDIVEAETAMCAIGQRPLFMIRPENKALDDWLANRDYEVVDPVAIYAADASALFQPMRPAKIIAAWPPLAIQNEIWATGGIGEPRLAVMNRSKVDKIALLGRLGDRAVSTTFLARHGDIAMLHALEVLPEARRRGVGATMMTAAANWAVLHGATTLALMVTRDNVPANALYRSLGMKEVGQYHYRRTSMVET